MGLQIITNVDVDFYNNKYILVNAKQHDKNSRYLSVACYNQGVPFLVNNEEHSAYIKYKKSDGYSVFNSCEIINDGKILIELTEQMLACSGICYADLVITNKNNAFVNEETGEIEYPKNSPILSTMTFCIDVSENVVENSKIESSYEYNALNEAIETVNALIKGLTISGGGAGFVPMGTTTFSELNTIQKATGFVYNVSDDFVTDDTFIEGAGKSYTAGTNIYFTSDGLWDCLGGSTSSVASVDEVKTYLGI